MRRVLRDLKDFDLIWFVRLRSPDMFPNAAWRCSVLDIDDLRANTSAPCCRSKVTRESAYQLFGDSFAGSAGRNYSENDSQYSRLQ